VIFVPVFAWPALFRIRADLGPVYNFSAFTDNKGDMFSLSAGPEGSMVFPQTPFSIIDKIPFLKEAGFRRFVVDLSGALLKKNMYRDLMKMITEGKPLPGASRYNWKDGFYQAKEA
jgi:putative protease